MVDVATCYKLHNVHTHEPVTVMLISPWVWLRYVHGGFGKHIIHKVHVVTITITITISYYYQSQSYYTVLFTTIYSHFRKVLIRAYPDRCHAQWDARRTDPKGGPEEGAVEY